MSLKSGKPSANPDTSNLSKISDKLKGMQKGLEKPIEMITKLWGKFSEMIVGLDKKFLTPLMAPFIGILNSFADMNPDKKKKDKEKEKESPKPKTAEKPKTKKGGKKEAVKANATKEGTKEGLKGLMGEIEQGQKPFDHTKIRSNLYEVGSSGTTLCSLTAKKNLKMLCPGKIFISIRGGRLAKEDIQKIRDEAKAGKFDLKDIIPTGNADEIEQFYLETHAHLIRGNTQEKITQMDSTGKTVMDIVTFGGTRYGHRAAGFKGLDRNWYVLDPYRYQKRTEPILFEEYVEKYGSDIKFVVPIDTSRNPSEVFASK